VTLKISDGHLNSDTCILKALKISDNETENQRMNQRMDAQ